MNIGPYKVGERPFPILVVFTDNTGQPINITTMTVKWIYNSSSLPGLVRRSATIKDGTMGEAEYSWVDEDFEVPGIYEAEMWAGTLAGVKLASVTFAYTIEPAVGSPNFSV